MPAADLRVLTDLPYRDGSANAKHRLDLFLPVGEGWPLLLFFHGGGWTAGNKAMVVAGADVYGNIGRFLASSGIGAAVVSYRLQPAVTWREQVADVAAAVAWVHDHAASYGGDPSRGAWRRGPVNARLHLRRLYQLPKKRWNPHRATPTRTFTWLPVARAIRGSQAKAQRVPGRGL
ncbi:MAG TPA: alpha/beta hydrolase fold domain-containing protein [Dehalococcoidia bacterium]|nr:alpha/beta hydrolase fold domain-containing protein [Dehalococcoidia bacterium]